MKLAKTGAFTGNLLACPCFQRVDGICVLCSGVRHQHWHEVLSADTAKPGHNQPCPFSAQERVWLTWGVASGTMHCIWPGGLVMKCKIGWGLRPAHCCRKADPAPLHIGDCYKPRFPQIRRSCRKAELHPVAEFFPFQWEAQHISAAVTHPMQYYNNEHKAQA